MEEPNDTARKKKPRTSTRRLQVRQGKQKAVDQDIDIDTDPALKSAVIQAKISTDEQDQDNAFWPAIRLTDPLGSSANIPPVFSNDGRFSFVASGSSVHVYSLETLRVVSTLSPPALSKSGSVAYPRVDSRFSKTPIIRINGSQLTSVFINPSSPLQLVTTGLDGCIRIWDYLDGRILRTIYAGSPIIDAAMPQPDNKQLDDKLFLLCGSPPRRTKGQRVRLTKPANAESHLRIRSPVTSLYAVSLKRGVKQRILLGEAKRAHRMCLSHNGRHLVAIAAKQFYIASLAVLTDAKSDDLSENMAKIPAFALDEQLEETLVSLALHPTESYFATGSTTGHIRLWYLLDEAMLASGRKGASASVASSNRTSASLHWHAHAVSSLQFTPNGAYLLSGGEEATLVAWQVESRHKEFIPRLGAPIQAINIVSLPGREQEFVCRLRDGTIMLIGAASMAPTRSIKGIKSALHDASAQKKGPSPLAIEPYTNLVVFQSSHSSSIQFYSPAMAATQLEIVVAPGNRVSRKDKRPLEPVRVERVAFCAPTPLERQMLAENGSSLTDATIMATYDTWHDYEYTKQTHLKFWRKTETKYELVTRIDQPHGETRLSSMAFTPSFAFGDQTSPCLVTASLNGLVKLWHYRELTTSTSTTASVGAWMCYNVLDYRKLVPVDCTFSQDGSILAVAYTSLDFLHGVVVLWSPHTGVMLQTLSTLSVPAKEKKYRGARAVATVKFAGTGADTKLIAAGYAGVKIWNLLSLQEIYESSQPVEHIVSRVNEDNLVTLIYGRNCTPVDLSHLTSSKPLSGLPIYRLQCDVSDLPITTAFAYPPIAKRPSSGETEDSTAASLPCCIAVAFRTGSIAIAGPAAHLQDIQGGQQGLSKNLKALTLTPASGDTRLFEELFGTSSTVNANTARRNMVALPGITKRTRDGLDIFSQKASHTLPPMTSLWRDLLTTAPGLKPYASTSAQTPPAGATRAVHAGDDSDETDEDEQIEVNDKIESAKQQKSTKAPKKRDTASKTLRSDVEYIDAPPGLLFELFKENIEAEANATPAAPTAKPTSSTASVSGPAKPVAKTQPLRGPKNDEDMTKNHTDTSMEMPPSQPKVNGTNALFSKIKMANGTSRPNGTSASPKTDTSGKIKKAKRQSLS